MRREPGSAYQARLSPGVHARASISTRDCVTLGHHRGVKLQSSTPGGFCVRVAMVFPGQGTQTSGMGAPWQDHPAWKLLEQAEGAPRRAAPPPGARRAGRATRPHARRAARGVVHVARRVGSRCDRSSTTIVAFAGHSLGQVTALVASGALDLEDGVRFAARRAELTQRAADEHPGRMAALLGATSSKQPKRAPLRPTRAGSRTTTRRDRS